MGDILSGISPEQWITGTKKLERHGATGHDWFDMTRDDDLARRVALTLQRRGPLNPTSQRCAMHIFGNSRILGTHMWVSTWNQIGALVEGNARDIPVDECDLHMTDQLDTRLHMHETCRLMYVGIFPHDPVTISTCLDKAGWKIQDWWPDSPWAMVCEQPYAHIPIESGWYLIRRTDDAPALFPKWGYRPPRITFRQARAVEYFLFGYLDGYGNRPADPFWAICRDQIGDKEVTTFVGVHEAGSGSRLEIADTHDPCDAGAGMVAYLG